MCVSVCVRVLFAILLRQVMLSRQKESESPGSVRFSQEFRNSGMQSLSRRIAPALNSLNWTSASQRRKRQRMKIADSISLSLSGSLLHLASISVACRHTDTQKQRRNGPNTPVSWRTLQNQFFQKIRIGPAGAGGSTHTCPQTDDVKLDI